MSTLQPATTRSLKKSVCLDPPLVRRRHQLVRRRSCVDSATIANFYVCDRLGRLTLLAVNPQRPHGLAVRAPLLRTYFDNAPIVSSPRPPARHRLAPQQRRVSFVASTRLVGSTRRTLTVRRPRLLRITTPSGTHEATRPRDCSQHPRHSHTALLCRIMATTYHTTPGHNRSNRASSPKHQTKTRRAQPVQYDTTKHWRDRYGPPAILAAQHDDDTNLTRLARSSGRTLTARRSPHCAPTSRT